MKIEILDENGNHVCYMDENSKEYKKLKRKETAKVIGSTVLAGAIVGGKIVLAAGLVALGIKLIKGK